MANIFKLALGAIWLCAIAVVVIPAQDKVNVTGTWVFQVETSAGAGSPTMTFKQEGEALTGKYSGQLGEADLKGTVKGKGKPDVGYAAANTISLIGSLLYAMDSIASDYTRRSAFLVGKLLAIMDELHRQYCVVVRDGAIPPSLIGNSLLGRASDSPAQALAELCDRSRPYIGWAKTVATPGKSASTGDRIAVHTARKLLRVAQPLCEQLGTDDALAQPMGDLDKAHLLLGYLSSVKAREASEGAADDEPAVDATNTTPDEEPTS